MKKYHVYGVGNALVDMEFEVEDSFFEKNAIDKGVMTLVDEARQHELTSHLYSEQLFWREFILFLQGGK